MLVFFLLGRLQANVDLFSTSSFEHIQHFVFCLPHHRCASLAFSSRLSLPELVARSVYETSWSLPCLRDVVLRQRSDGLHERIAIPAANLVGFIAHLYLDRMGKLVFG